MPILKSADFIDFSDATSEEILEDIQERLKRQVTLFNIAFQNNIITNELLNKLLSCKTDDKIISFSLYFFDFVERTCYIREDFCNLFAEKFNFFFS